jgi:hypothetical protein
MVSPVHKRLLKPLVYLVAVAQLLLAVPASAVAPADPGSTALASAASVSSNCEAMAGMGGSDECPCCPDGVDSMSACLASCSVGAVSAPTHQFAARLFAPSVRVERAPSVPFNSLSDPPLKPPPIV